MSNSAKQPSPRLSALWKAMERSKNNFTFVAVPLLPNKPIGTRSLGGAPKVWDKSETASWKYDVKNHLVGTENAIREELNELRQAGYFVSSPDLLGRGDENTEMYHQLVAEYKKFKHESSGYDRFLYIMGLRNNKDGALVEYSSGKSKEKKPAKKGGQRSALLNYIDPNFNRHKNGKLAYWDIRKVSDSIGTGARVVHYTDTTKLREGRVAYDNLIYDINDIGKLRLIAPIINRDPDQLVKDALNDRQRKQAAAAPEHVPVPDPVFSSVKSPKLRVSGPSDVRRD